MSHLDMRVSDAAMHEIVIECCLEWGIVVATLGEDLRRFFGDPEDLHVLKMSFS